MSNSYVPPPQGPQGPVAPKSSGASLQPDTDIGVNRFLPPDQAVSGALDPEMAALAFARAGAEEADEMEQQRQAAMQAFAQVGYEEAMEAKGAWETSLNVAGSVGKSFGDALFNAGAFIVKSGYGIAAPLEGRSFVEGYEEAASIMEQDTGTRDPGILDVFAAIGKDIGIVDQNEMDVGARADVILRGRLGQAALATETAGFLASFAVGGGANLAKLGAPLGKAAPAVGRLMSKPAERAIAKIMAKSPEEAAAMLSSGKTWQALTSTPEWRKSASMFERTLALGGRNTEDLLTLTGANVVQSYAMSTDAERNRHVATAAYTSPFLLPLGKIGSAMAGKIASAGMDLPTAKLIQGALKEFETGKITAKQLSKQLWSSSNPAMRGLGNAVASSFEGTMFMGLSPEAHDLFAEWMGGDMDAGAKLQAMWLGSVSGVAVTKGLVPGELAPLFKRLRPEANTLDIYIEAHSNKLSANDQILDNAVKNAAFDSIMPA